MRFFRYLIAGISALLLSAVGIFALDHGLTLTPPLGWNAWNWFLCHNYAGHGETTDTLVIQVANAFITSGMRDSGYQYVNIDDCWAEANRDAHGGLVAYHRDYPRGMKVLADSIHARGLKFGMYTDLSTKSCTQNQPGLYGHEQQDCDSFVAWGIDYLKVDFCQQGTNFNPQTQYALIRDDLYGAVDTMKAHGISTAHEIVFSICDWGNSSPWIWGMVTGNLWRTTGDMLPPPDCWTSMLTNLDGTAGLYSYAGPGGWNDPDMLYVGWANNGGMTETEGRAHFSLWCMMAAPLLAGNDPRNMNAVTKATLTNGEAIRIDQDSLGKQGRRVVSGNSEVWSRLLKSTTNSEYAVLLFNRNNSAAATISATTAQIMTVGGSMATGKVYTVRDVWSHANLANFTAGGTLSSLVGVHDVVMLRLTPYVASPVLPPIASVKLQDAGIRRAGEFVTVNEVKAGPCAVAMTDLRGRLVYSGSFTGPSQHGIDTRGMARGIYLVNVRNGDETFFGKVLLK
jgi:alpha-galactosidase